MFSDSQTIWPRNGLHFCGCHLSLWEDFLLSFAPNLTCLYCCNWRNEQAVTSQSLEAVSLFHCSYLVYQSWSAWRLGQTASELHVLVGPACVQCLDWQLDRNPWPQLYHYFYSGGAEVSHHCYVHAWEPSQSDERSPGSACCCSLYRIGHYQHCVFDYRYYCRWVKSVALSDQRLN